MCPSPRDTLPPECKARAQFLRDLDAEPEIIATACGRADAAIGASFPCVLPAHAADGIARITRRRGGRVAYVCDCDEIERSMTEVYMTRATRLPRRRSRAEYVRWKARLAIEAGRLTVSPMTRTNTRAVFTTAYTCSSVCAR
jgi:hypothetical protein